MQIKKTCILFTFRNETKHSEFVYHIKTSKHNNNNNNNDSNNIGLK